MLDRFKILTDELDHPEGVAWGRDGRIYAGGEAGQIYAISLEGEVEEVANTGGSILGLAVDAAGSIYACDEGNCEVVRIDPESGRVQTLSSGTRDDSMREPNYPAFDTAGNLYVTDSGGWQKDTGLIFRINPGGNTSVWSRFLPRYPNGCCLSPDGRSLYIVESCFPGVSSVPILSDGSAGDPAAIIEMPGTVPDGIALDSAGDLYIACYRPDRIYRFTKKGVLEILADDPTGVVLNTPTNVAFVGPRLDLLAVANVGEWHLLLGDIGRRGTPLFYPRL
jgi:gluconolactonase